jgi:hypothetical protein
MTRHLLGATLLAALLAHPAHAQTREVPVCSDREEAQMLLQYATPAARLPEGCRLATVRRLDSPAGALCQIDIGTDQGIAGAVTDAVATTEWWTACANLRAP